MLSSLSSLTKVLVAGALVATSTAAMAQDSSQGACQGTNCVLPLGQPAPLPPVETTAAPVDAAPYAEAEAAKGLGILPLVIGAVLAAVGLYFLLDDDENEDEEPVSP